MIDPSESVASDVKACCAAAYGSDAARFLLGDSFHPGGAALTVELAGMLELNADSSVLDVASGTGASAFAVAERFGCRVTGVDLSAGNIERANEEADRRGLSARVTFMVGDAERLPVEPATFDALLCECAFCTFPDKPRAAAEFARVLKPGGRVGMSDLTRVATPLPELDGLLAWIACIGDARPVEQYAAWLSEAGFAIAASGARDDCLQQMIDGIQGRLLVADIMIGLRKLELPGLDLRQAKTFAVSARRAVQQKQLGYALLVAQLRPH